MQQVTGKATMVFFGSVEVGSLVEVIREEGGHGSVCEIISTPREADKFLATNAWDSADLIVLDRQFRGIGANELIDAVRTSDINPNVPIVLINRPSDLLEKSAEPRPRASATCSVPYGQPIDWEELRPMFQYWLTVNVACPREIA